MSIPVRKFDSIVVGAGGSGMRASLELACSGLKTAVLTKVFPTRSHTVAAEGGIAAPLGNSTDDNWHWHMYDTVKGADYLGDQDAIEYMCRRAIEVVVELEHMGMPFDRLENGRIYQRPFGGHTQDYGSAKMAMRACAAADRTGHAMLHTLYQQNVRANTQFLVNGWRSISSSTRRTARSSASPRSRWKPESCASSRGKACCSPRAAPDAFTGRRPTLSSTPATAWAWWRAPDCRSRTWSSGSSIRPVSRARACSSPKACAVRAATCSTRTASASWSAMRRTRRTSRAATWCRAP